MCTVPGVREANTIDYLRSSLADIHEVQLILGIEKPHLEAIEKLMVVKADLMRKLHMIEKIMGLLMYLHDVDAPWYEKLVIHRPQSPYPSGAEPSSC
jgi:hypothetical protein